MHFMANIIAAEIAPNRDDPVSHLDEWVRRSPGRPEPMAYLLMAAYRLGERDATRRIPNPEDIED